MFAKNKKVKFIKVGFGPPSEKNNYSKLKKQCWASFEKIDFSPIWHFDVNIEKLFFKDCIWKKTKKSFLKPSRYQLAGEEAMIKGGSSEVVNTYKKLAAAYKLQDEWENASDWRYSAKEAQKMITNNYFERMLRLLDYWVIGCRELFVFPLMWSSILFLGLVIFSLKTGDESWLWRALQSFISKKGIPPINASETLNTISMLAGGLVVLFLSIAGRNFANRHGWFLRKSSDAEK